MDADDGSSFRVNDRLRAVIREVMLATSKHFESCTARLTVAETAATKAGAWPQSDVVYMVLLLKNEAAARAAQTAGEFKDTAIGTLSWMQAMDDHIAFVNRRLSRQSSLDGLRRVVRVIRRQLATFKRAFGTLAPHGIKGSGSSSSSSSDEDESKTKDKAEAAARREERRKRREARRKAKQAQAQGEDDEDEDANPFAVAWYDVEGGEGDGPAEYYGYEIYDLVLHIPDPTARNHADSENKNGGGGGDTGDGGGRQKKVLRRRRSIKADGGGGEEESAEEQWLRRVYNTQVSRLWSRDTLKAVDKAVSRAWNVDWERVTLSAGFDTLTARCARAEPRTRPQQKQEQQEAQEAEESKQKQQTKKGKQKEVEPLVALEEELQAHYDHLVAVYVTFHTDSRTYTHARLSLIHI